MEETSVKCPLLTQTTVSTDVTGGRRQLVVRVQSLIQGDVGRQLLSVPRLSSVQDYIRRAGLQSPSGISPSSSGWRSRGTWETETPRRSQHHVEVGPVISSSFLQLNLLLQGTASLLPKMWTTMSSIAEALGSSRRMMVSVSLWWQLNSNLASLLKINGKQIWSNDKQAYAGFAATPLTKHGHETMRWEEGRIKNFFRICNKSFRYGLGIVAEEYVEGQMIDIEVELTAYHQVNVFYFSDNSLALLMYVMTSLFE